MNKKLNLLGDTYGQLSVISENFSKARRAWLCRCTCGNLKIIQQNHLRSGDIRSCGCYAKETTSKRNYKHGRAGTRLYRIWGNMLRRCYRKIDPQYPWYGGRGITVCPTWKNSFKVFEKWALNNGYKDNLSIDRLKDNLIYSPKTCWWATDTMQQRNKRKKGTQNNIKYTSKFIGVCFESWTQKWRVQISVNKKSIRLGRFSSEVEAAKVRDKYIIDNNLKNFTLNF